MNRKTMYLYMMAGILLLGVAAPARAMQRSTDNIAVFGVWTPLRFTRGQLDDHIPPDWQLGFFEKEREGLNRAMREAFSDMMPADMGYTVVDPSSFERLSSSIYRKIYTPYNIDDVNQRYNWAAADDYAEMLNVRYVMFGDVTLCDVSDPNNVKLQMYIIVYDSVNNQPVYLQQFGNNGRMAQVLSTATLRRAHPEMDDDIIWFLRTPLGRAALIVYDDFASSLTGEITRDFSGDGTTRPDITDPTVGASPAGPGPAPGLNAPKEFASDPKCSPKGDTLILSAADHGNHLLVTSCVDGKITVKQSEPGIYAGLPAGTYAVIGNFEKRGTPMMAVAAAGANDDIRLYAFSGSEFNFKTMAYNLLDVFEAYNGGVYLAAGDFDGDGIDELALSTQDGRNEVLIYSFKNQKPVILDHIATPYVGYAAGAPVAAGDFDADGRDELVLSPALATDIRILKFDGTRFNTTTLMGQLTGVFPGYTSGCHVAAGDFDGDGADELAVSPTSANSSVKVYEYAAGRFAEVSATAQAVPGYTGGLRLAAGDFDADGRDELVVAISTDNDEARILRFDKSILNVNAPMSILRDVFLMYNGTLLVSAGAAPQAWTR